MRHMVTALLLCLAAPVAAQDWQVITDEFALTDLLIAHDLTYETGAWQSFEASGRTLYRYGESSWGYWRIEGGQYCSQWPPNDDWACYDVSFDGHSALRFTDARGNISTGVFAE